MEGPLLERWGVRYFRTLSQNVEIVDDDGVHFLNDRERAGLRGVVRGAVIRAALAGAISTIVSAAAEVLATPLLGPDPNVPAALGMTARFWLIVVGATILASIIEIGYLYWDGLRAVHRMAVIAGLDLFGQPTQATATKSERSAVAEALARAALELPNPAGRIFGVNPRRDASRLQLAIASLVYKLKISVTNFVVKALVRRALGRSALRGWLSAIVPFAAVPVTALWNGVVAWLVLREALLRTMGPSAARVLADVVIEDAGELSREGRSAMMRAVACSIVRTEDLHPNLVALLEYVAERTRHGADDHETLSGEVRASGRRSEGLTDTEDLDDAKHFIARLAQLAPNEQRASLRILCIAAVLDGRITRKERALISEAFAACKREPNVAAVDRLRRTFVRGETLSRELIETIA